MRPKKYESMKACDPKIMKVWDSKSTYESMRPKKYESMQLQKVLKYESMRPKKYERIWPQKVSNYAVSKKVWKYATQNVWKYVTQKVWKYARHEITFGILMLPASGLVAVS